MTSRENIEKLGNLRDEVWQLARESLDSGDRTVYRTLIEVAEKLTPLVVTSSEDAARLPHERPIFARYKGTKYEATFGQARMNGGRSECVLYNSVWMTPSNAATRITGNNVNGWRFWKYQRDDGSIGLLTELR